MVKQLVTVFFLVLFLLPLLVHGGCTCDLDDEGGDDEDKDTTLVKWKLGSIVSILVSSAIGICLPMPSKVFPSCQPGSNIFFMIKAFSAGVILSTGFIHVLPDAFEHLTSPCLKDHPWGDFPFTGFIAMVAAIGTLMVKTVATSYFQRRHFTEKELPAVSGDVENAGEHAGHVHVHSHATHGHAHGTHGAAEGDESGVHDLIRHRVISQVLELGIVVHSVIIGISLGASGSASTVKTLLIALSFHQLFEGMGLGGCISQGKFRSRVVAGMMIWFAITTPLGVAIGIGISNFYRESSPIALIVEGCFNSASAGILIYMALVDLLAADFMSTKVQTSGKLQLLVYICLLAGAGFMSLLAKWA